MDRTRGIGGSDAIRIMRGDWLSLYNEKVGLTKPEDLSNVFRVQLGILTEPLHRKFFEMKSGLYVTEDTFREHPVYTFMNGHLDGWIITEGTFLECKHTGSFANLRDKARYYMAQLQHYMAVAQVNKCYFSCIFGNNEPEYCTVTRDDDYIAELITAEQSFWWHVQNKIPPEDNATASEKAEALAKTILIDDMRSVDMSTTNSWAVLAQEWLDTIEPAKINEDKAKEIKALVPDDAAEAFGSGIIVRRDRRGRLSLRKEKET
jgi:predicted phage-related endonuclease